MKAQEDQLLEHFVATSTGRASHAVASAIREAIFSRGLNLGERLPNERDLGLLFGVSRASIREALRTLEATGLIEIRRGVNGGAFVSAPGIGRAGLALGALIHFGRATPEQFAEFRLAFETQTAREAAERADSDETEELLEAAHRIAVNVGPEVSWEDFLELDIRFHELVAVAAHNPIRVAVMLGVHGAFREFSRVLAERETTAWRKTQASQLMALARSVQLREPDEAAKQMELHLLTNNALAWELLERPG